MSRWSSGLGIRLEIKGLLVRYLAETSIFLFEFFACFPPFLKYFMQNGTFWRRKLQSTNFKIENVEFNNALWFRTPSLSLLVFKGEGVRPNPSNPPPPWLMVCRRYDKRRHHTDRNGTADCVLIFSLSVLHFIQLSRGFFSHSIQ